MSLKSVTAVLLSVALAAVPAAGMAAEPDGLPVMVKANMARILKINAPAATVIIGNPGIADVTIQDPKTLVLTGKSYGQTNLIVLDAQGNPIADTLVEVIQEQGDLMTVYQGPSRTSLACAPKCEPTVMLGDDVNYSSNALASANLVKGQAE